MLQTQARVSLVVGTRPQLIKAGQLLRTFLRESGRLELSVIDTDQHYDESMASDEVTGLHSRVRLQDETNAPRVVESLIRSLRSFTPLRQADCVATIGDTNSTLAATLVAADIGRPIVHIEAGLRSFDRSMPEERNRLIADHISDLLLAPSQRAMAQLQSEGLETRSKFTGDISYDLLLHHMRAASRATVASPGYEQVLFTVHRPSNVDDPERLRSVFLLAAHISRIRPVLFPAHPRVASEAATFFDSVEGVTVVEPLSHRQLLSALVSSPLVITDSGGVQREAFWLATRCVTLRTETEWVETLVDERNNLVEPTDLERVENLLLRPIDKSIPIPEVYGNGNASRHVYSEIEQLLLG